MDVRFRPLPAGPGLSTPSYKRKSLPGKQTYTQILDRLETELTHLRAQDAIIETGHRAEDIRLDGYPRSSARVPSHPGVVLYFDAKASRGGKLVGPLRFSLDAYSTWQDNLRALVLTLEALRAVDRYGATQTGEQYRGYAALPPPSEDERTAKERAAHVLLYFSGESLSAENIAKLIISPDLAASVGKRALLRVHPDTGGRAEDFRSVQAARQILTGQAG